jgi:hypothetical protein
MEAPGTFLHFSLSLQKTREIQFEHFSEKISGLSQMEKGNKFQTWRHITKKTT